MANAPQRPAERRTRAASPDNSPERMQWAPARHVASAQEVGVREWGQLLVERGQQLLSRGMRDAEEAAQRRKPSSGRSRRQRSP